MGPFKHQRKRTKDVVITGDISHQITELIKLAGWTGQLDQLMTQSATESAGTPSSSKECPSHPKTSTPTEAETTPFQSGMKNVLPTANGITTSDSGRGSQTTGCGQAEMKYQKPIVPHEIRRNEQPKEAFRQVTSDVLESSSSTFIETDSSITTTTTTTDDIVSGLSKLTIKDKR